MLSIKRILIPTDFSDFSVAAIEFGKELARTFSGEIHLLHVLQDPAVFTIDPTALPMEAVQEMLASRESFAMEELNGYLKDASGCGDIVRTTRLGRPANQIVAYASENNIDLIVISTHGRTGLTHLLLGSVAESVVRLAGCPVLTVRSEPDAASE